MNTHNQDTDDDTGTGEIILALVFIFGVICWLSPVGLLLGLKLHI